MPLTPTARVILYHVNPAFGRMYLTANGDLSNQREQAAEHYAMQADAIIEGSWLLRRYEPVVEVVHSSTGYERPSTSFPGAAAGLE